MTASAKRATKPRNGGGKGVAAARERGMLTNNKAQAALVDPDKPLTDQQRAFVKLWASGETVLSAAIKAGYADGGTYAYRMVHMPNILKLYQAEKDAYEQASGMSRKKVMDGLMEAVEMAKLMAEPSTMVAGWREIGKMCGYYEPVQVKHTITHEGKVMVERMEKLTDAELFELIQKQAAAMGAGAPNPSLPGLTHDDNGAAEGQAL